MGNGTRNLPVITNISIPVASTAVQGTTAISVAPAVAASPISLGVNDNRVLPAPSAAGRVAYDAGSGQPYATLANGTTGQVLIANAGAAPSWSSSGVLSGLTSPRIPYSSGGNTLVDSANLTWSNTNLQVAVGTATTTAGKFVSLGTQSTLSPNRNENTIGYSIDGLDWMAGGDNLFGSSTPQNNALCTNGTRLVACLSSAKMAYSNDYGISWTTVDVSALITTVTAVCWNGTKFVAVGSPITAGGTGKISITSTDGISWAAGASGTLSNTFVPVGVVWNGTVFAAIGGDSTNNGIGIVTSTDGSTWAPRTSGFVGDGGSTGLAIAWGNSLFIGIGNAATTGTSLQTSADGTTWTTRSWSGTTSQTTACIAYNGTNFVVGDSSGGINYSPNGTTGWTLVSPVSVLGTNTPLNSLAWNGIRFVVVASPQTAGTSFTAYSADGITWTTPTVTAPQATFMNGVSVCALAAPQLTPTVTGPSNTNGISVDTITAPGALTLNPTAADIVVYIGKNLRFQDAQAGYVPVIDRNLRMQFSPFPSTRRNVLLNGDFPIDQRNEGAAYNANGYTLDRWLFTLGTGAAGTVTKATISPAATTPLGSLTGATIGRTTTGSTATTFEQRIENVSLLNGFPVVLSFWAIVNSGTAPNPTIILQQNFGAGGSPSGTVNTTITSGFTMTTSWKFFSFPINLPTIAGKTVGTTANTSYLGLQFQIPTSVGNTNFTLTQVQLEVGNTPTTFDYSPVMIELSLVQRYHCKSFNQGTAQGQNKGTTGCITGAATSTTAGALTVTVPFPAEMRAAPTMTLYNTSAADTNWFNATLAVTSTSVTTGTRASTLQNVGATVAGRVYQIHYSADAEL